MTGHLPKDRLATGPTSIQHCQLRGECSIVQVLHIAHKQTERPHRGISAIAGRASNDSERGGVCSQSGRGSWGCPACCCGWPPPPPQCRTHPGLQTAGPECPWPCCTSAQLRSKRRMQRRESQILPKFHQRDTKLQENILRCTLSASCARDAMMQEGLLPRRLSPTGENKTVRSSCRGSSRVRIWHSKTKGQRPFATFFTAFGNPQALYKRGLSLRGRGEETP